MSRNRKKDSLDVGYFAVAFFDLMGQQERLRKLTALPESKDSEEYQELVTSLKGTYGAVTGMRRVFRQYFEAFGKTDINIKNFPKEKRNTAKQLFSNPIKFHQFSDFIVAYMSLADNKGAKLPTRGIHGILGAAAATSILSLASGHPIRGGVDLGVGIEVKHNEIYGAPLARAYALESHVANYPRVVIGEELSDYLIQCSQLPDTSEIDVMKRHTAELCKDLIAIDNDGYPFVDFLGQGVYDQFGCEDNDIKEVVKRGYEFVLQSSAKYQEEKNTKIAFKYTLLRNYIESRLSIWGIST